MRRSQGGRYGESDKWEKGYLIEIKTGNRNNSGRQDTENVECSYYNRDLMSFNNSQILYILIFEVFVTTENNEKNKKNRTYKKNIKKLLTNVESFVIIILAL